MLKKLNILLLVFIISGCQYTPAVQSNDLTEITNADFGRKEDSIDSKETLIKPIAEFEQRITKKPFGIYITPSVSPVQPERFSGYHTGVDAEYSDVTDAVPVYAIADGIVKKSGWINGYGGMTAIEHTIADKKYIVIYGHLDPNKLKNVNDQVVAGEVIGQLGQGYSHDTDNERKHLHFSVYVGTDINIRGYAGGKDELSKWIDPLKLYK